MNTARLTLGCWAAALLAGAACTDETSPKAEPLDAPGMQAPSPAESSSGGAAPRDPALGGADVDADDGTVSEGAPNPIGGVMPEGAAPAESAGCSGGSLLPGDHERSLSHDGQSRQYLVHVPESYDGSAAVPLVLDIHGLTSNARQQALLSGWRAKADEAGFIVVHPDGLGGSWNGGALCCGSSQRDEVDDEGFMRAIVAELQRDACIDAQRVYATGLSNGGAMSHLLGCRAADVFAATAPVSMGNGARPCEPSRPISVVMTRGTRDRLVAYDGGLFPSAAADLAEWAALNGCEGEAELRDGVCETHDNCAGGVEVTLCTLDAGHVLYDNAEGFSVPDVVWSTFERQLLP